MKCQSLASKKEGSPCVYWSEPLRTGWHPVPGITAGLLQAWIQGAFSYLFQWFWVSELSPCLCPLLPSPLTLECCVSWLRACDFVCLPTRAALYRLLCIFSLLGALEPDMVPEGTVGSWSCALCSPEPWFPLMAGDCEFMLCRKGDTSI